MQAGKRWLTRFFLWIDRSATVRGLMPTFAQMRISDLAVHSLVHTDAVHCWRRRFSSAAGRRNCNQLSRTLTARDTLSLMLGK